MEIFVAPNAREWDSSGAKAFRAIAAELETHGYVAHVQTPRNAYVDGGIVIDPLVHLSIFLWEHVADETISLIVGIAVEHLRQRVGSKRHDNAKRRGRIYGPNGDVLREFDLDD